MGCGTLGGFVPMLRSSGYEAIGIDPEAPDEAVYRRIEFENAEPLGDPDAFVASTSLHHVADPVEVLDRVASALAPGGVLVVIEWAWETFDEPTAAWCFERLRPNEQSGWLHRLRDGWLASENPWRTYLEDWARSEQLHSAESLLRLLDERFEREQLARGPIFFPDLAETSIEDEQAAIDRGRIRATRVDYTGRLG